MPELLRQILLQRRLCGKFLEFPWQSINDAYDIGCELQRKRVECAIMIKAAAGRSERS